jgi:hypothetical protein
LQEFAPGLVEPFRADGAVNLAAARQKFAGAVQPLMSQNIKILQGLGPMSEMEFKAANEALPKFGLEKEATEFLLDFFERKSGPIIQRADAARSFMETNPEFGRTGFLRFNPAQYSPPTAPPPAAPTAEDPLGLRR